MVVRIIYRPSYPWVTVTRRSAEGDASSIQPEAGACAPEPAAKPLTRSQIVLTRSLALFLARLGFGAMVIAAWRIATDLGLPIPFLIKIGILSHWQVWFGAGVLLVIGAGVVARRLQLGKAQDDGNDGRAQAA